MLLLYYPLRLLAFIIGCFPVSWVARFGHCIGLFVCCLDKRHCRVAQANLKLIFGDKFNDDEIKMLAKENTARVVEAYVSAISTLQMTQEQIEKYVTFEGVENIRPIDKLDDYSPHVVGLIGHFGNFELYTRLAKFFKGRQFSTTYRGFDNALGDKLLAKLRSYSGCLFFERRRDFAALKNLMSEKPVTIGLLADQHPGDGGKWFSFMGIECRCSVSPAVLALKYNCPIQPAFCYRVAPGRWKIILDPEIPTRANGNPRTISEIIEDVNKAYEKAILRDIKNWLWGHRRWKSNPKFQEVLDQISK